MASPIAFPADGIGDDVVTLRSLTRGHLPSLTEVVDDPEIVRFTMVPSPYGQREADEFLRQAELGVRSGTQLIVAVAAADEEELCGTCAVRQRENDPAHWAVGYWIARAARGRGFASRAVRLICAFAFVELGARRISLLAEPENEASVAVAERCGFRREGLLRAYQEISGARRDLLSYSLLPGDPMG